MQGVGPGTVLGGRYTTQHRLAQLRGAERWSARDVRGDRNVSILCFPSDHPAAPAVLDAARRAVSVDNPRLVRVVDVGSWAGMSYVVEEATSHAQTVADLLGDGGLPSEEVRRISGEVATALEAAGQRGLHHLGITPASVLRFPDGSVKLAGVATECALAGTDDIGGAEASLQDAVGVVALAYAGLTGRWPLSSDSAGLAHVPQVVGGVPAPSEIAAGVPDDLDSLCRRTLNGDDGPRTPGEYAAQIGSWSPTQVGGFGSLGAPRAASAGPSPTPTTRTPSDTTAVIPAAGASHDREVAARVEDDLDDDTPTSDIPVVRRSETALFPQTPAPPSGPSSEVAPASGPTSAAAPAPSSPAPAPVTRAMSTPPVLSTDEAHRERDHSLAAGAAGGLAGAGVAGAVGGVGARLGTAGAAAGQAAAQFGGRVTNLAKAASDRAAERVAERVADRRAFREAARHVEASHRVSFDQTYSEDGYEAPAPLLPDSAGAAPSKDQTRTVLIVFAGFVLIAFMFGIWGVSKIGSGSNVDSILGSDATPPATAPQSSSSASQGGETSSSTDDSSKTSDDTSGPVAILNVTGYDPNGDGSENNSEAGRVYDENPDTYWTSEGYFSADLGGLKPGVGLIVDMGQSVTPKKVELQLPTASDITLYLGDDPTIDGTTEIGSTSGKSGTVDINVDTKAKGEYIIVWFTRLSQATDGRFRATLSEISIFR